MKLKHLGFIVIMTALCLVLLTGCGRNGDAIETDLSVLQTDISSISVPENVKVVGLGEASHGVREYQLMKAEVFKALVFNNGCRTFVIEGDFGGALKVDDYIHGGMGEAEAVIKEIGFSIYHTREMAELVEWMRSYNENAPAGEDLHFYGMDMQRYDNNKEFLFSVLDKAAPELSEKYKSAFAPLTDEARLDLSGELLRQAKADALELAEEMDAAEKEIADIAGQSAFDFARECVRTIYACADVALSSNQDYNVLRDKYMFEKIGWFMQRGYGLLFINGHNGHIGKTSVSGYTCLGELLAGKLGKEYFAIGTDAADTKFNSQNGSGDFSVMEVSNQNVLNSQLKSMEENVYYIDFQEATADGGWQEALKREQKITALNVGIAGWQKLLSSFYTTKIIPQDMFDGMIVFQSVFPTTLIAEK